MVAGTRLLERDIRAAAQLAAEESRVEFGNLQPLILEFQFAADLRKVQIAFEERVSIPPGASTSIVRRVLRPPLV